MMRPRLLTTVFVLLAVSLFTVSVMEWPRSASGLTSLVHSSSKTNRVQQVFSPAGTQAELQQQQQQQQLLQQHSFLVHEPGYSCDMILRSPSIAGINLIENWSDTATNDLRRAIRHLVDANPILRGRACLNKANQQLWITSTARNDDHDNDDNNSAVSVDRTTDKQLQQQLQEDFLHILPMPENAPDFSKITGIPARLDAIQKQLIPLFHPKELTPLTSDQIFRKLPLFGVTLLELPNNFAAYAITMSHAVGDGVTFFQLIKELSLYMSHLPVGEHNAIDWNCPQKATHEFAPPGSTKRDAAVTYGPALMAGALVNFPFLPWRQSQVLLLKKEKVNACRRALRAASNTTDISGNDVITAAVCEACQSSDLFFFTENARRQPKDNNNNNNNSETATTTTTTMSAAPPPIMAGGNFLHEIPVSRQTAIQPQLLRKVIQEGHGEYYHKKMKNALPVAPFLFGRVGRVTSLASIAENVVMHNNNNNDNDNNNSNSNNKTATVVCTLPLASFIQQIPLDVAMIFRYDKQHWGVLHNFQRFNKQAPLISEILA
jgi:hypothetical protein